MVYSSYTVLNKNIWIYFHKIIIYVGKLTFKLFNILMWRQWRNDDVISCICSHGGCSRDNAVDSYIVATEDVTSNSGEEPWFTRWWLKRKYKLKMFSMILCKIELKK